jgi:hypothetical protein
MLTSSKPRSVADVIDSSEPAARAVGETARRRGVVVTRARSRVRGEAMSATGGGNPLKAQNP